MEAFIQRSPGGFTQLRLSHVTLTLRGYCDYRGSIDDATASSCVAQRFGGRAVARPSTFEIIGCLTAPSAQPYYHSFNSPQAISGVALINQA